MTAAEAIALAAQLVQLANGIATGLSHDEVADLTEQQRAMRDSVRAANDAWEAAGQGD